LKAAQNALATRVFETPGLLVKPFALKNLNGNPLNVCF